MSRHLPLDREFCDLLAGKQESGFTCDWQPAPFVPQSVLLDFWTIDKIRTVCIQADLSISPTTILQQYLTVFSILVYLSRTQNQSLELFEILVSNSRDDSTLPWTEVPSWLDGHFNSHERLIFDAFLEKQWPFCPVLLSPKKPLSNAKQDRRRIFPFGDQKAMGTPSVGREATVCSVAVNPRAHEHLDDAAKVPSRVVLKSYPDTYQGSYDTERSIYNSLNSKTQSILACLGSFYWQSVSKNRTSTLVLEFAEGGTLLEFFQTSKPPYMASGIKAIWMALLEMVIGLEIMHEQDGVQIVHQDLKPANILVFPPNQSKGKSSFVFKIADFGASSVLKSPSGDGPKAIYSRTTRPYSAPELQLSDNVRYNISPKIDMWSLGCIFTEAGVWLSLGESGWQDFKTERAKELSALPEPENRGQTDCFHNGSEALKTVRAKADLISSSGRRDDNISAQVVHLTLRTLLVHKDLRHSAGLFRAALARVVHDSQGGEGNQQFQERSVPQRHMSLPPPLGVPVMESLSGSRIDTSPGQESAPSLNDTPEPSTLEYLERTLAAPSPVASSREQSRTRSSYPHVSIKDVAVWREEQVRLPLLGWNKAQPKLQGRDFIFLIDDSESMKEHQADVIESSYQLSYIVKKFDSNGLDVLTTSNPRREENFKTSTEMKVFTKRKFRDASKTGQCDIEFSLNEVFKRVFKTIPRLSPSAKARTFGTFRPGKARPFSILVFTNGVWNPSDDGFGGADRLIERCIKLMKDNDVSRSDVAIQFVRFGNNPKGKQRLKFLDDGLKERPHNDGYDIVDTKPWDAGIWDILVGAVDRETDLSNGEQADVVARDENL